MNNLLRAEEDATKEMDELLADIRTCGLEVLKGEPDLAYSAMEQRVVGEPEEIDVSLVQGVVYFDDSALTWRGGREAGARL